jgi:hypothetical protein
VDRRVFVNTALIGRAGRESVTLTLRWFSDQRTTRGMLRVATVSIFLASEKSAYGTGQTDNVCAGLELK